MYNVHYTYTGLHSSVLACRASGSLGPSERMFRRANDTTLLSQCRVVSYDTSSKLLCLPSERVKLFRLPSERTQCPVYSAQCTECTAPLTDDWIEASHSNWRLSQVSGSPIGFRNHHPACPQLFAFEHLHYSFRSL